MKEKLEDLRLITDAYQQAAQFLAIVKHELEIGHSFLSLEESKELKRHYHRLENIGDRCLSYWQNQYAPKVQHLAESSKPNRKILDAGFPLSSVSSLFL